MNVYKELAGQLRWMRMNARMPDGAVCELTKQELAVRMGCTPQHLSQLEGWSEDTEERNRRSLKWATVVSWAEHCGYRICAEVTPASAIEQPEAVQQVVRLLRAIGPDVPPLLLAELTERLELWQRAVPGWRERYDAAGRELSSKE